MMKRVRCWMRRLLHRVPLVLLVAAALGAARQAIGADTPPDSTPVFDVPKVVGISVDGNANDWKDQGLVVETMGTLWNRPWPMSSPSPQFRLGWDERGLLACVTIYNPTPHEYDDIRHLFKGDSVEFFVSSTPGSSDRYMLVISPGLDPKYPEPRHCFFPDPSEAGERDLSHMTYSFARHREADHYTIEALLPWSNLKLVPQPGRILGLQIYAMEARDPVHCIAAMWHPAGDSHADANAVHSIRLSASTARSTAGPLAAFQHQESGTTIRVVAPAPMAGKALEVRTDSQMVVGTLLPRANQATALLDLAAETAKEVAVSVDGHAIPTFSVPDADNPITVLSSKLRCSIAPCVFLDREFPSAQVSGAPGYRVSKVTYYDADFRPVQTAEHPGRYGAAIELVDRQGNAALRFRTLFRMPERFRAWRSATQPVSALPAVLAQDSQVLECLRKAAAPDVGGTEWLGSPEVLANPRLAALLAYLCAEPGAPGSTNDDFGMRDRQWWVQLKGKLYGTESRWAQPLVRPAHVTGQRWPTVRKGSEAEAGVKPGTAAQIDDICARGAALARDAVSVCVVRHGICFLSKAYGQIGDKPMTVDTACHIYSASKPLAGTLMMMMCDQGLVTSLDDEVAAYLPPFRRAKVKSPLTIRQLYNHRAGFPLAVWEDDTPDIEEIVAGFYPALSIGVYRYSDTGYSVAGKLMESLTGQTLPRLEADHILRPLGMSHTRAFGAGHGVWATAEDYARLGQLLLNRGGYGDQQFFSEATFAKMLPGDEGGIGIRSLGRPLFGEDAFGHDGSNSSFICISPSRDAVVVVVSAGSTKDFTLRCGDLLLKTVSDGIVDTGTER